MATRTRNAPAQPKAVPTSKDIAKPSAAYNVMAADWQIIHDLRGGTKAMRAARTRWLPMHEKEDFARYNYRLERSWLYSGYTDTVDRLANKPFVRSASFTKLDEMPPRLQKMFGGNVNNEGASFDTFSKGVFKDAMDHGLSHVMVEFPVTPPANESDPVNDTKFSPYLVHITAEKLVRQESRKLSTGERQVVRAVVIETEFEFDPKTGVERERCYARDWRFVTPDDIAFASQLGSDQPRGGWALWRKEFDNDEWMLVDSKDITFVGCPIVTYYTRWTGYQKAEPPMHGLAELNVQHWQTSSDQNHILHFARSGIIKGFNLRKEDTEKEIVIGPSFAFLSESAGSLDWMEHSGAAINSGRQDVLDVEARMEVQGMLPLLERAGNATATSRAIDTTESQCEMQSWVRDLEKTFEEVAKVGGRWIGEDGLIPDDFSVDFFSDFVISARTSDADILLRANQQGVISKELTFGGLRLRGIVPETADFDEDQARIAEEGPNLGDITALGGPAFGGGGVNTTPGGAGGGGGGAGGAGGNLTDPQAAAAAARANVGAGA